MQTEGKTFVSDPWRAETLPLCRVNGQNRRKSFVQWRTKFDVPYVCSVLIWYVGRVDNEDVSDVFSGDLLDRNPRYFGRAPYTLNVK